MSGFHERVSPPNSRSRLWLLIVPLSIAVGGYLAAMVYMKVNERSFVYHPDVYGGRGMVAPAADLHVTAERIESIDSLALSTWTIPPADSATALGYWVLVNHGNAGNISLELRQEWSRALAAQGVGIVSYDYRSYGVSDDGPLDEEALYRDAQSVYDWMVRVKGIDPQHIIIYGHSLGSGVATHLAANVEAAGLILEGAFTSIPDVGASRYPWMPIRLLSGERFASVERIDSIAMPKLFMHASDDGAIPFEFGKRLYDAAPAPKEFVTLTGGHDRAFAADSATYFTAIGKFVRRVASVDVESPALPD